MDIETQPAAARVFVSGTATLKGKDEEVDEMLGTKEKDGSDDMGIEYLPARS